MNRKLLSLTALLAATAFGANANPLTTSGPQNDLANLSPITITANEALLESTVKEHVVLDVPIQKNLPKLAGKGKTKQLSGHTSRGITTESMSLSCFSVPENSAYFDTLANVGDQRCFTLTTAQNSKIKGLAVNQPAGANYDLQFFELNSATGNYDLKDFSTNASGDDITNYVADAGSFLFLITKQSGSSAENYIFGTFSYTGFDQYEANDKSSAATLVSGGNLLTGNLDHTGDFDYYRYTFDTNQNRMLLSMDGADSHQLEIFNGSWMVVPVSATGYVTINAAPGVELLARVVPKPGATFNAAATYQLKMNKFATSIVNTNVWTNDQNLTDLATFNKIEAHATLGFSGRLVDESGAAVPGELMRATVFAAGQAIQMLAYTDENGRYNFYYDDLPQCSGSSLVERFPRQTPSTFFWRIRFDDYIVGYTIEGTFSDVVAERAYAHICSETVVWIP